MKTALVYLAAATFLLTAMALPASAQWRIGVGAGASLPAGNFPGAYDNGFNLMVSLARGVPDRPLSFRFDAMVNRFGGQRVFVDESSAEAPDHSIYALTGNVVLRRPGEGIRPYGIAGAGYYNQNGGTANQNLGFNAGGGVELPLGRVSAFVETRYHNFVALDLSGSSLRPARLVPITLGIRF